MFRYMVRGGWSVFSSFGVSILICSPPDDAKYVYVFSFFVFRYTFPSRASLVFFVSRGLSLIWMEILSFSCMGTSSFGSSSVISS